MLLVSTRSMSQATHKPPQVFISLRIAERGQHVAGHVVVPERYGSPVCSAQGKCTFAARLTDEEVQQLTQFVLDRAAAGWK